MPFEEMVISIWLDVADTFLTVFILTIYTKLGFTAGSTVSSEEALEVSCLGVPSFGESSSDILSIISSTYFLR
jgi:hypothetical protein